MKHSKIVFFIVAALIFLVATLQIPSPIISELLFGWFRFIKRVVPNLTVRWDGIATFAVAFAVATTSGHYLLSWMVREINERRSMGRLINWTVRSTVLLAVAFMLLFVIGIAVTGVVHQIGWLAMSPESIRAEKTQSDHDNNLSTYRPGGIAETTQRNWLFHVLPFVPYIRPELVPTKAWNDPENADEFRTLVYEAICPSQGNPIFSPDGFGLSHRVGNVDVFGDPTVKRFRDIDDLGNTIFAGDVNAAFTPWGDPTALRSTQWGIREDWTSSIRGEVGFGSAHEGGALILMGDGATTFIGNSVDPVLLRQLGRARKEEISTGASDQP